MQPASYGWSSQLCGSMLSESARSIAGILGDAPVLDFRESDRWAAVHDVRVLEVAAEDHRCLDVDG